MQGLVIQSGDLVLDSRGRLKTTTGLRKVAYAVDYELATSPYIASIYNHAAGSLNSNEMIVRNAIQQTLQTLISRHKANAKLTDAEKLKRADNLQIYRLSGTSYSYYVELTSYADEQVGLNLEKSNG